MLNLYNRIVRLCSGRGIKPGRLCVEVGISKGNLTELKMGRTKTLSQKNLIKISQYFNVTVDYLLGNDPQAQYDDATYEIEKYRRLYDMETDPEARAGLMQTIRMLEDERDDPELREYIENKLEGQKNNPAAQSDEVAEYLQAIHDRPELKVLFKAGRNATPELLSSILTILGERNAD